MTYTDRDLQEAFRNARNRFFRSAGIAAILGVTVLFLLMHSPLRIDVTLSSFLFSGFIVGFYIAGLAIPQAIQKELKKSRGAQEP